MFHIKAFLIVSLLLIKDVYTGTGFPGAKEIKKLLPKKKEVSKEVKLFPLQEPFEKEENGKIERELSIALLTHQLGFIYCDVKQDSFMGAFVEKYAEIRNGHEAILNTFKKTAVEKTDPKELVSACKQYLKDDVLQDNGLRLTIADDFINYVTPVEREINFDYFMSYSTSMCAIQCPVKIKERTKMIYFSARGTTTEETGKHYFVFADYSENDKSKFTILMRTVEQETHDPLEEEPIKSNVFDHPDRCPIRLQVKPKRWNDNFRLFGKDAEIAFISEKYRFFNTNISWNYINQFIEMVHGIKKGYETDSDYDWFQALSGKSESEITSHCYKYVKGAAFLQKYNPDLDENYNDGIVELVSEVIKLQIPDAGYQHLSFFQCPSLFQSEELSGRAKVKILPVHYKSPSECGDYAFYYVVVNESTSKEHREIFFSSVNTSIQFTGYSGMLSETQNDSQQTGEIVQDTSSEQSPGDKNKL